MDDKDNIYENINKQNDEIDKFKKENNLEDIDPLQNNSEDKANENLDNQEADKKPESYNFIREPNKKKKIDFDTALNIVVALVLITTTIMITYINTHKKTTYVIDPTKATQMALNQIPIKESSTTMSAKTTDLSESNTAPVANFIIKTQIRIGDKVEIEDRSYDADVGDKIVNYHWEGKQNIYTKAGTYPITLKVQDSRGQWSAPTMHVVEVVPKDKVLPNMPAIASFTATNMVYVGEQVVYKDNSYCPDGSPVIDRLWKGRRSIFNKAGIYTVTLQVRSSSFEWSDVASQSIVVRDRPYIHNSCKPTALFDFEKSTVLTGETVVFKDMSYDYDGDRIVEREWSGNKQTKYSKPGEYLITLRVKDEHGNLSEAYAQKLTVELPNNDRPVAEFRTNSPVEVGQKVTYTDLSYDIDGTISKRVWGGDKRYSYTAPGTYDVTLTVWDDKGKQDTITHKVIVLESPNTPPTTNFTVNPNIKAGERVYYYLQAYDVDPGDAITSVQWVGKKDFFDTAGDYTVGLYVKDKYGATGYFERVIHVEPNSDIAPVANISGPMEVLLNKTAIYTDVSTDADGFIASNSWGSKTLTMSWNTTGTKYIRLQVTDNDGRMAEKTIAIVVKQN